MIDLGFSLACTHQGFQKAITPESFNMGILVEKMLSSFFQSFTDQSSIQPIEKPKNDSLKTPFLPDSSTDRISIQPIEKPKNDSLETPPNFSLDSTKIDCTEDQLKKDSERNLYFIDERRIDPENVHSTLLALMEKDFKNVKPKFLGSVTQGIMLDGCLAASKHFYPAYLVTQQFGDKPEFSINTKERTVTITNHFSLLSTQDNKPYRFKLQCKTLVDFKTDEPSGKISYNFIAEPRILFGQG
jgi:hypothetical protein